MYVCMSRSCCELENRVCRNKLRFSTYPGSQIRQLLKGFQVPNYPSRWFRGTLVGIWGRYVICLGSDILLVVSVNPDLR